MKKIDVHKTDQHYETGLKKLENSNDINKQTIEKFIDYCHATGLAKKRVVKYIYTLLNISKMIGKPFKKATKDDLIRFVGGIEKKEWSDWTKHDYKIMTKRLYKWLEGNDEDYPAKVKWLKTTMKNGNKKLPEDILTEEEIFKIAKIGKNLKHKAMVLTLYESGARIEEFLTLTNKKVQFDENGCILMLEGKTGMRRVRIISSAPVLQKWLEKHPLREESAFPLWVAKLRGEDVAISYSACKMLLSRLAEKAKVNKRVNPHAFRHARATHLSRILTHSQLCQFFGWTQGSEMAGVYVHLSGKDIDNTLLASQGLRPIDEKEKTLFVRVCPKCQEKNSPLSSICVKCAEPLTQQEETKKTMEDMQKRMENMSKALDFFAKQYEGLNDIMNDPDVGKALRQKGILSKPVPRAEYEKEHGPIEED